MCPCDNKITEVQRLSIVKHEQGFTKVYPRITTTTYRNNVKNEQYIKLILRLILAFKSRFLVKNCESYIL